MISLEIGNIPEFKDCCDLMMRNKKLYKYPRWKNRKLNKVHNKQKETV